MSNRPPFACSDFEFRHSFVIRRSSFGFPKMVSVAGLAPARVGLKIRLRELLCIHGQKMVAAEDENPELLLAGRH
jgi:hypothetical protein